MAFRLLLLCGDRSARRRSAGTFCLIIRLNGQLRQIFPPPAPMSLKPRRPRRSRPPPARYDGDMNQCAGLLFAGKRGTGPWAAHGGGRSPANASSTTGHSAKHRAKQQGWALEVARQGQTAAPGRRRFPDGDWLGNGDGGWTVFQIPSTPGLESF